MLKKKDTSISYPLKRFYNTVIQILVHQYLWNILFWGCTSENSNSTPQGISSKCLEIGEQKDFWVRLGSPVTGTDGIPAAPSLIVVEDQLWLYYSLRNNLNDTIYLTTSPDGEIWEEPKPIFGLEDDFGIKHIHVYNANDTFQAYMGGGVLSTLESEDGLSWTKTNRDIIENADFDEWGQLYPSKENDRDRFWYTGFSGTTYSIGMAEYDGTSWLNQGAVLEPDQLSEYENSAVAQSTTLHSDDGIFMWYGGYDTSNSDPGPWRILSAMSEDGLLWNKQGLALDLTSEGEEAYSVREPSVVFWREGLWMAYISMGEDSIYRLRLAHCK